MSDGAITDNSVPDTASLGGGIYNDGQVTLTRVQVENNTTGPPYGGGIYTDDDGTTTVTYSTIAENHSAFGGGFAGTGALSVTDSLIRGNTASDGGGAWIVGCNPTTFQYDTFSGNGAGTYGGAVRDIGASIFLFHDKVADNVAGQLGGGLATAESNCPAGVDFRDTIMAGNQTSAGLGMDCVDTDGNFPPGLRTGDNISDGHNIIGDADQCGITPSTGDRFGTSGSPVNPKLAPLQNNGGPTFTMALLPGSPAIGAADRFCGHTDQRGFVIADDGDHGGCDIGAFEFFNAPSDVKAPKITGARPAGATLSCSTGTWRGGSPISFAFQWLRNGKEIRGSTRAQFRNEVSRRAPISRIGLAAGRVGRPGR